MRLYRVYAGIASASPGRAGHPLTVPPVQGAGRIDNPGRYGVLYVADTQPAAVGERFGDLRVWSTSMLAGRPYLPGSRMMLAVLRLDGAVCDLDDPDELSRRGSRPSRVVTRDRETTQRWAREIHDEAAYAGVRWWWFWNPDWGSAGVWHTARLTVVGSEPLTLAHPAVTGAAMALDRPLRDER
ncbi:MAG: RES domain-containing protein [Egibacteraceae bacterium]